MLSPSQVSKGIFCLLSISLVACTTRGNTPQVSPAAAGASLPAVTEPAPASGQTDPALELIALSTLHFEAGQRELGLGRLDAAKREFNRALEVLLESPLGGRTEPRVREHFDRL